MGTARPRKGLAMKRFLAGIGLLALCLVGDGCRHSTSGAAQNGSAANGSGSLAQELAAAKKEGLPTTAQELQAPLPPETQNAAPLYTKLTALLKVTPLTEEEKQEADIGRFRLP